MVVFSAIVSVVAAVSGSISSNWHLRMYFSIVQALFDLFFIIEFVLQLGGIPKHPGVSTIKQTVDSILQLLSSVLPFILVSGPFILGWAAGDFSLAAVRGYWLSPAPIAMLSTVTALRLLRPLRLVISSLSIKAKPFVIPLILAGSVLLVSLAAIVVDGLVLPGYRKTLAMQRQAIVRKMDDNLTDTANANLQLYDDILALAINSELLYKAPETTEVKAGDYDYYKIGHIEAWFHMTAWQRARSLLELALNVCILGLFLALWSLYRNSRQRSTEVQPEVSAKLIRGRPVGEEEIQGILGR
ncbi:MAG: hypothetical protein KKC64_04525 [Spirochaetes bacterium]|nr:hypothetical protein [Spirochaetota bacterium]